VLEVLLIFSTAGSKLDLNDNLGIKMCMCVGKCFLSSLGFISIFNGK